MADDPGRGPAPEPADRPTAMDNATGKRLLALVRDADYAHPGEEEANHLLFAGLAPDPRRRVLDAGCGGAGTAAWVQARGYGAVTGIEIDAATAALARERHPEVTVVQGDLQRAGEALAGPFDLIYSMTAIYAAPDHAAVFRELGALAAPGAELRLLEYADPRGRFADEKRRRPEPRLVAPAPPASSCRTCLAAAGWTARGGPRPPAGVRASGTGSSATASPRSAANHGGVRSRLVRLRGARVRRHPRAGARRRCWAACWSAPAHRTDLRLEGRAGQARATS